MLTHQALFSLKLSCSRQSCSKIFIWLSSDVNGLKRSDPKSERAAERAHKPTLHRTCDASLCHIWFDPIRTSKFFSSDCTSQSLWCWYWCICIHRNSRPFNRNVFPPKGGYSSSNPCNARKEKSRQKSTQAAFGRYSTLVSNPSIGKVFDIKQESDCKSLD